MIQTLAAFFAAGVGIWAKKVLVALGVGVISYAGFSQVESILRGYVQSAWSGVPATAYDLFALAGFVDMFGIYLSAASAAVALQTVKRFGVMTA